MLPGERPTFGLRLAAAGVAVIVAMTCLLVTSGALAETLVVTKQGDPIPGSCKKADCSLREAIRAANAKPGEDTVLLPSRKRYELSRPSTGEDAALDGDLDVANDPLRVIHPGKGLAIIDANGIDRVFEIFAGAPTALKELRITGGDQPSSDEGNGGGIRTDASLRLVGSAVTRNHASGSEGSGGGIKAAGGKLTVIGSAISRNVAADSSGAIDVENHG